jgi:hypothetical protein
MRGAGKCNIKVPVRDWRRFRERGSEIRARGHLPSCHVPWGKRWRGCKIKLCHFLETAEPYPDLIQVVK